MSLKEQGPLSLREAQKVAQSMQELVGDQGISANYAAAHSQLIERQTKESLADKNFLQALNVAVGQIDSIEKAHEDIRNTRYYLEKEEKAVESATSRLRRLQSDEKLLLSSNEEITRGGNTLTRKLYGDTLYIGLIRAVEGPQENQAEASILDKLRQANRKTENGASPSETISLSEPELALIKKTLPAILKEVETEIEDLQSSLAEHTQTILRHLNQLSLLNEKSNELTEAHQTTISILDELEIKNGAPQYPAASDSTENQYQSYLDRINWRRKQLEKLSFWDYPRGKTELGRKWAFITSINGENLVLNQGHIYDDVYPLSILTNRTPGETLAIYAEGMITMDQISVQAIIENGIIQPRSYETMEQRAQELEPHFIDLNRKINSR